MTGFFTPERFGRWQYLAAVLLLAFLGQSVWLIRCELLPAKSEAAGVRENAGPDAGEMVRITAGWRQLHGGPMAGAPYPDPPGTLPLEVSQDTGGFDTQHSPLIFLATAAPLLVRPQALLDPESSAGWRWLPRIPFLLCGVLLGASLWYVARRLCGNTGGLLALSLYCFSPSMIQASAVWHTEPQILASWGAFGTIFTSIAVAHTLYAPREVVLWNWRRIVLLGVSMAIAVGSEFAMIVVAPVALALLLYLAPIRRGAAVIIWIAACVTALVLLLAVYFFHPQTFYQGIKHASFWGVTWRGFEVPGVYRQVALQILRSCPAFALLLPVAIATFVAWPRSRYFGNAAPAMVSVLFIALAMAHPHVGGAGFLLASFPFLFIFVSGTLADLMETSFRPLVSACTGALVGAYVLWSLLALFRVPVG